MFFLLDKHADDGVFNDFAKLSDHFPKIFKNCSEGQTFSENFRKLDKLDISEIIDIFTCEDVISSTLRMSYCFYQFITTQYTTDFYIIKKIILRDS